MHFINSDVGVDSSKGDLAAILESQSDMSVMQHFVGEPHIKASRTLNEAIIFCLDLEWWDKPPHPTTEIGIAELDFSNLSPTTHAGNILSNIRVAHARVIENAHLANRFQGAGNPEEFYFGTTKFVTKLEAREILINTFHRPRQDMTAQTQPIILLVHGAEEKLAHVQNELGIDLAELNTVVKVIDTQNLAEEAGVQDSNGPKVSLKKLLDHFSIQPKNLHTAGNDAAFTIIAAVLMSLKTKLYGRNTPGAVVQGIHIQDVAEGVMAKAASIQPPWGTLKYCTRCSRYNHLRASCRAKVSCKICKSSSVAKLVKASATHDTTKCMYNHLPMPHV